MEFEDVMVDLETLGTKPGCSILSIGAVAFNPQTGELGERFYIVVNRKTCEIAGLTEEEGTIHWWSQQSDEAKLVLSAAEESEVTLLMALNMFKDYLVGVCPLDRIKVWGNGSDFDNTILRAAYEAVGNELPWKFWNNRCFRTLKALAGNSIKMARHGTYHNALDDAVTQANHAVEIFKQWSYEPRN